MTETCCREVNKWTCGVLKLCLCGFKSLLVTKESYLRLHTSWIIGFNKTTVKNKFPLLVTNVTTLKTAKCMLHNQSEQHYKLVAQAKHFISIPECTATYQCAGVIILTYIFNHNVHVTKHARQQIILVYRFKSFVDIRKKYNFFFLIQHARRYALLGLACKVCNIMQANVQAASWHGTNTHFYFRPLNLQDSSSLDACLH